MITVHPCLGPGLASLLLMSAATDAAGPVVHFENSCSSGVTTRFDDGITMLHSFEYPESARIFEELIEDEADCAMAYWGAAMSVWHPLWEPPGPEDVRRGAQLLAGARKLEATAREQDYIEALGAFFSSDDSATHRQRVQAYATAMSAVYAAHYETDPEAAVFYALALIAAADPRDKAYGKQFRAAGLLNWVRESQPTHPGVLHYLIHAYDYPGLAHLAFSAASTYANAAPDSAHAQHMPSHIFTRLGLWDRSLASNHDSTRSAVAYMHRAHLPGHYDEELHSIDYLMYAMLQTARDEEAASLLADLAGIERTNKDNFKVAYTYVSSPARFALERRAWAEAANLVLIRPDFPWDDYGYVLAVHHFARGIGAARSGQVEKAQSELEALRKIQPALPATTPAYWREQLQVQIDALNAWILFDGSRMDEALVAAQAAADREDSVDKHPVTPGEVLPARELYADLLMEAGNPGGALAEYEAVLGHSPNRLNALVGAANAAQAAGRAEIEKHYRSMVREQAGNGTGSRAEALRANRTQT